MFKLLDTAFVRVSENKSGCPKIIFKYYILLYLLEIPVSRKYQRLTTYGFDLWGKPSQGYDKDIAYDLRVTG